MPRLLVEKGPDRGKSVTIAVGGQIVAGRDKDANLQLSDTMASRRHFLIASKGSIFGLKDLNSANGTLVNGRKAEGAHKLAFGDSIQVGETLISWLPDEQTDKHGGLIGQQIGGYRIEERLGRGAMGTVYKATQLSLGRTVALKVLSPDLVKDEKFCEMFVKEARAAGSLNHPNIIQVYDVGDEGGQYFFSMEFAAKGSVLEELGKQKSISLARAVQIIRHACNALDYAERKGLVHRDIKPDNLMVTEDDTVKLGDLGLAMSAQELQAEQDGVFGTPHYIAPEQAMGKPIDHRADIYALGATFYRMLTGRTLFSGATVKEILKKQVREPHAPITDHMPDCPQAIARIIDRMLAKNPAERYQHASEIANDLSDWENLAARKSSSNGTAFAERPTGLTPEQSQQLAQLGQNRRLVIAAVVAIAAIMAAAFSLWFFLFSGSGAANEIIGEANNGGSADHPPPVNSAPEVPADVAEANEALKLALGIANLQVSENPNDTKTYKEAIGRLEEALARNPKAGEEWKSRVNSRLKELEAELAKLSEGAAAVNIEWDETFRDCESEIKEFKYKAAGEKPAAFIKKYEESSNEEILDIVERARDYLNNTYPASVKSHSDTFDALMRREVKDAEFQDAAMKAATVESVAVRVRDAEAACDDEYYKSRLGRLADEFERQAKIFKAEADRAERKAIDEAFTRCSAVLAAVLERCRGDLARGDFKQVSQRLTDFKLSDADFIAYQDRERFKPIVEDLKRREQQSRLEHQALLQLQGALPEVLDAVKLLKSTPWPEEVVKLIGSPASVLRLKVKQDADSSQWTLEVSDTKTMKSTLMNAGDFDTREKRATLCTALSHLIRNHAGAFDKLMQPAAAGGPPALAGVFAWMCELEAYEPAFPLIEHAYSKVSAEDPQRPVVREYYAWGLLGKANAMAARGDRAGAQALIQRLESEFADTRANKGRN
ncbi:MAG: protein kinase [Planctomycetes bacterium]|nr:protein kinase [Planctomycetota bacterium]MCB9935241.1 protein kinase [Planctomycetota bacterium]